MAVLITGGGRGIGREIAIAFAATGESVAVVARSQKELDETVSLIEEQGSGRAIAIVADVSDRQSVRRMASIAKKSLGPIEVVVNNAGSPGQFLPVLEVDPQRLVSTFATNVFGPFYVCQAVVPDMVERGDGYVVNITSLQGSRAMPGAAVYGASKAALMRITDTLGQELDGTGVVVFDVSPGLVHTQFAETPGLAEVLAEIPESEWVPPEKVAATVVELVSGKYDSLNGRFIHALDDLDVLVDLIDSEDIDARRLRMASATDEDPLFT